MAIVIIVATGMMMSLLSVAIMNILFRMNFDMRPVILERLSHYLSMNVLNVQNRAQM
jgi:hypothetical protein